MEPEWAVTNRFIQAYELESFSIGEGLAEDLEPAALIACELRGGVDIDIVFRREAARKLHELLGQMIDAWAH